MSLLSFGLKCIGHSSAYTGVAETAANGFRKIVLKGFKNKPEIGESLLTNLRNNPNVVALAEQYPLKVYAKASKGGKVKLKLSCYDPNQKRGLLSRIFGFKKNHKLFTIKHTDNGNMHTYLNQHTRSYEVDVSPCLKHSYYKRVEVPNINEDIEKSLQHVKENSKEYKQAVALAKSQLEAREQANLTIKQEHLQNTIGAMLSGVKPVG